MADFVGSDEMIALQRRVMARQDWIKVTPAVSNGGRILNVVDPAALAAERIRELAEEDGLLSFVEMPRDGGEDQLRDMLGPEWHFPRWDFFRGAASAVLAACQRVCNRADLPKGWSVRTYTRADAETIAQVQALNAAVGMAALPRYYMAGEAVPTVLGCIWDANGVLAATAAIHLRFHSQSLLAGQVFDGLVSVAPDHRGRGLGKLINAKVLLSGQRELGWTQAFAFARADNAASVGLINACGMQQVQNSVTIVAQKGELAYTR